MLRAFGRGVAVFGATPMLLAAFTALLPAVAGAQEKKPDVPRCIAVAPMTVSPGTTVLLKIRGTKLSSATEVRFPGAAALTAVIKQKKAAEVPNGLDGKDVGDTLVEAEVVIPADCKAGAMAFVVVTPEGDASGGSVQVRDPATVLEEKEPDNGFSEAQVVEFGRVLKGSIKEDKDVDVFRFAGRAKQRVTAELSASCCGSLLDAGLTLFDAQGQILAMNDDHGKTRDPRVNVQLPADGAYFLSVNDVHDRGGAWHNYELSLKEVAP